MIGLCKRPFINLPRVPLVRGLQLVSWAILVWLFLWNSLTTVRKFKNDLHHAVTKGFQHLWMKHRKALWNECQVVYHNQVDSILCLIIQWEVFQARRDRYLIYFYSFWPFNKCLMTKNLHKSVVFERRYYISLNILICGGFLSSNIRYKIKLNQTK